jgi:hypothetical protein
MGHDGGSERSYRRSGRTAGAVVLRERPLRLSNPAFSARPQRLEEKPLLMCLILMGRFVDC